MKTYVWLGKIIFILLVTAFLTTACKQEEKSDDAIGGVMEYGINASTKGSEIYSLYCAGCHDDFDSSDKGKRNYSAILYSIENNAGNEEEGYMEPVLSFLVNKQDDNSPVQRLAKALADVPFKNPSFSTGKQYYDFFCQGCHGDLSQSDKAGRNMESIKYANRKTAEMYHLQELNYAALSAVGSSLQSYSVTKIPSSGSELYESLCKGCHGEASSSDVAGASVSNIKVAFSVSEMVFLQDIPGLTDSEILKIADLLAQ